MLFLVILMFAYLLTPEISRSQGQTNMQLKNDPVVSFNSCENVLLVSAGGNEVHALFPEQHNCFYEIQYKCIVTGDLNQGGYFDGPDQTVWLGQKNSPECSKKFKKIN